MTKNQTSILIVDDDVLIRQLLSRIVLREGFHVSVADNGKHALSEMEARKYDFVITDIQMPEMDGFELMGQVRERYPQIMVVLITGFKDGTLDRAKQAGADGLITKPFKNTDISRSLNLLVAQKLKITNARTS